MTQSILIRRVGGFVLGFAWLVLVFSGLAIAFSESPYPVTLGWMLLAIAAALLLITMQLWVSILPGILAVGTAGALITLATGHVLNHPEVPVSRLQGLSLVIFFASSAVLSTTFSNRRLNTSDRIGIFAFVLCIFWQVVAPRFSELILASGFFALVVTWLVEKKRGDGPKSNLFANSLGSKFIRW